MKKDSQIDNTPKMHIQIYSTPKKYALKYTAHIKNYAHSNVQHRKLCTLKYTAYLKYTLKYTTHIKIYIHYNLQHTSKICTRE